MTTLYVGYAQEPKPLTLDEVIKAHIEKTLKQHRYHMIITCTALGISRSTLYRKIKMYSINTEVDR